MNFMESHIHAEVTLCLIAKLDEDILKNGLDAPNGRFSVGRF